MIWLLRLITGQGGLADQMRRAVFGVAVLAVLVGAVALWRGGGAAVRDQIEIENKGAENAAQRGDIGFSECDQLGGMFWDFGAGVCRGISGSGGR